MGLRDWVKEFGVLHAQARIGALTLPERQKYLAGREELAAALLAAQRLELKDGMMARQSVRVQRTLPADITVDGVHERGMTLDISVGGFAAMLGPNAKVGDHAQVAIKLPGGEGLLESGASVVNVRPHGGVFRVSFAFVDMPAAARERLGFLIFDVVLETFK